MDYREPSRLNSSEPPGMMMPPCSYDDGGVSNPNSMMMRSSPGMVPNIHGFGPFISCMTKPMDTSGSLYHGDATQVMRANGVLNVGETVKKKRGRPRKYGLDGGVALALLPISSTSHSNSPMSKPDPKRRGRPPGSGKKQQLDALGSAGSAFTPHVITVNIGEDVASKIIAFSQQGRRTVCVLSANGSISNVTICQATICSGTATYEGRFDIISLSGSYSFKDGGSIKDGGSNPTRTGGLRVFLAGQDGRILGGVVAGMLKAASPVQVVIGSFISEGKKPKPEIPTREPSSVPSQTPIFGEDPVSSPSSQGVSDESSDDPDSPKDPSGRTGNNSGSMPCASSGWAHYMHPHWQHEDGIRLKKPFAFEPGSGFCLSGSRR